MFEWDYNVRNAVYVCNFEQKYLHSREKKQSTLFKFGFSQSVIRKQKLILKEFNHISITCRLTCRLTCLVVMNVPESLKSCP